MLRWRRGKSKRVCEQPRCLFASAVPTIADDPTNPRQLSEHLLEPSSIHLLTNNSIFTMAAERLSSIVSQLTPGQKPLDKMYARLLFIHLPSPQTFPRFDMFTCSQTVV